MKKATEALSKHPVLHNPGIFVSHSTKVAVLIFCQTVTCVQQILRVNVFPLTMLSQRKDELMMLLSAEVIFHKWRDQTVM